MYAETKNTYEVLYWWLQTTDPSQWTEEMQELLLPLGKSFDRWWKRCGSLFANNEDLTGAWVCDDPKNAAAAVKDEMLVIIINELMPAREVIREIRSLLKGRMMENLDKPRRRGRPEHLRTGATFNLHVPPSETRAVALSRMLAVYKEWLANEKRPAKEKIPRWKFYEAIGLDDGGKPATDPLHQAVIISRYLNQATMLRANLINGEFLKYK